jgi:pyrroline-5-carboxylate reductase
MHHERIGFIGAGNIAESMIRGFITSGHIDPGHIMIADVRPEQLERIHQTLGPTVAVSNRELAEQASIVFLAVKPAQVQNVAREISEVVRASQCVVSIAAGTSLAHVREGLGTKPRLCRIMPNLAANVRKSTISLFADPALTAHDLAPVYSALSQLGKVFRVEDEKLMAVITALSGSAPAYYVMMAEALVGFGVSQGMSKERATSMILGTMEGSAAWALNSRIPMGELWRKVVTPGGTTEAGMQYYQERGFLDIFVEGLRRSTARARQLGDE